MTTASEERYGVGYLEERRLSPRWPAPVVHLVNLVLLLAVFYATWWIFQDPRGCDAPLHAVRGLHVHPLVADRPDLDGVHLPVLADAPRATRLVASAAQGGDRGAGRGGHHVGGDPRLLPGLPRQDGHRLFRPDPHRRAAEHDGVLRRGVRGAGDPDVRGARVVARPGLGDRHGARALASREAAGAGTHHPHRHLLPGGGAVLRDHASAHGDPLLPVAVLHRAGATVLGELRRNGERQLPRRLDHVRDGRRVAGGNDLGALSLPPDRATVAAPLHDLLRHHRHRLGLPPVPLLRAGTVPR